MTHLVHIMTNSQSILILFYMPKWPSNSFSLILTKADFKVREIYVYLDSYC